jgi:hypothetical protein
MSDSSPFCAGRRNYSGRATTTSESRVKRFAGGEQPRPGRRLVTARCGWLTRSDRWVKSPPEESRFSSRLEGGRMGSRPGARDASCVRASLSSAWVSIRRGIPEAGAQQRLAPRQDDEALPNSDRGGHRDDRVRGRRAGLGRLLFGGGTLDDALDAAKAAAAARVDAALDGGDPVPAPSSLDAVRRLPAYGGWTVGVLALDPALFDDSIERVDIALPKRVLRRLDDREASEPRSLYRRPRHAGFGGRAVNDTDLGGGASTNSIFDFCRPGRANGSKRS